jgi:hypothetical protein
MRQWSGLLALAAALAFTTSAIAIEISVSGSGGASASAGTPAGSVSAGVGAGGGASVGVNPGGGPGVTGAIPPRPGTGAGASADAQTADSGGCAALNATLTSSDAEINAVRALSGNARVTVQVLSTTACRDVRNPSADIEKLRSAITANVQLATALKAKQIEIGNIVAVDLGRDGTVLFYTLS